MYICIGTPTAIRHVSGTECFAYLNVGANLVCQQEGDHMQAYAHVWHNSAPQPGPNCFGEAHMHMERSLHVRMYDMVRATATRMLTCVLLCVGVVPPRSARRPHVREWRLLVGRHMGM